MPSQAIPTLITERLTLRAPVAGDFPAYARLLASPRAKGIGGPYAQRAAWGKFCHGVACWDLFGHGALMMDLLATSECVGLVDISHGPLFPEKELSMRGMRVRDTRRRPHRRYGTGLRASSASLAS